MITIEMFYYLTLLLMGGCVGFVACRATFDKRRKEAIFIIVSWLLFTIVLGMYKAELKQKSKSPQTEIGSIVADTNKIANDPSIEDILSVILQVNPDGKFRERIGPYQLSYDYWKDAVEFNPTIGGEYKDCKDIKYSQKIVVAYWQKYCPEAYVDVDAETLARVYDGGPLGNINESTLSYWNAVENVLKHGLWIHPE